MFCGWKGNRRSGVALAMRHRLSGLSTYGSKANVREISVPPKLHRSMVPFMLHEKDIMSDMWKLLAVFSVIFRILLRLLFLTGICCLCGGQMLLKSLRREQMTPCPVNWSTTCTILAVSSQHTCCMLS